jgi:hypothetical protein
VDDYLRLFDEFARGPVTQNQTFQSVFRSFYRLDIGGLTPEFKSAYFECMESARRNSIVDLTAIVKELHRIPNRKGQKNLQFSFVTKLAHTINPNYYPIYDAQVAKCFAFRAPYNYKPFDTRLQEYLAFYESVRKFYEEAAVQGRMKELIGLFEGTYSPAACRVPPVKVWDFIFWSAGRLGLFPGL